MSTAFALSARQLQTLGAIVEGQSIRFRVWAPERHHVDVVILSPAADHVSLVRPLIQDGNGYWSGEVVGLAPGSLYKYRLDGREDETLPDPASRYQPGGVHGPSAIIDPGGFAWSDREWSPPPFDALSIYELHVGTFTTEGTFRSAAERLPSLVELGVTAIELMPVADFAGTRNWGYDGVALYAPARCYGTPDDLRALVDAAHRLSLAVFLDVVYNHFGPDGAYANVFSPYYFTDRHRSPWGKGVNLDGAHSTQVRRFFIENAWHWVSEYHIDGLRLDATHCLVDDSAQHFLAELTHTVKSRSKKPIYFIAEDHRNLAALLRPAHEGGYGIDAVWADDFHHQLRVHTAGDRESYYADFSGSVGDIARTLELGWFFTGQVSAHQGHPRGTDPSGLHPRQFVVCIQNHDQVGNRADGARLNHQIDLCQYRALSTLLLLAPQTPLLFMGQEWAARSPFLFFTDHHQELGRRITTGRGQEFRGFAAFADPDARTRIPDPQDRATFEASRLKWDEIVQPMHASVRELYRRLLALRQSALPMRERGRGSFTATTSDPHTVVVDYSRRLIVVARLSGGSGEVEVELPANAARWLSTEDPGVSDEPTPIVVERRQAAAIVRFVRPGAIVFCTERPSSR